MTKSFQNKNNKHMDSYVYTINEVQLLEYKVSTWVLSKISPNMLSNNKLHNTK